MASNVIQTLLGTRVEHPIEDVDAWVERLTAPDVEHSRDVDARLLTEREAEWLVRRHGRDEGRQAIADAMDISPSRVDNLRYAVEADLLAAEATLDTIAELRTAVRPDSDA